MHITNRRPFIETRDIRDDDPHGERRLRDLLQGELSSGRRVLDQIDERESDGVYTRPEAKALRRRVEQQRGVVAKGEIRRVCRLLTGRPAHMPPATVKPASIAEMYQDILAMAGQSRPAAPAMHCKNKYIGDDGKVYWSTDT